MGEEDSMRILYNFSYMISAIPLKIIRPTRRHDHGKNSQLKQTKRWLTRNSTNKFSSEKRSKLLVNGQVLRGKWKVESQDLLECPIKEVGYIENEQQKSVWHWPPKRSESNGKSRRECFPPPLLPLIICLLPNCWRVPLPHMTQGNTIGGNQRSSQEQRTRWPPWADVLNLPLQMQTEIAGAMLAVHMWYRCPDWRFSTFEPLHSQTTSRYTPPPTLTLASMRDCWISRELWVPWRYNLQHKLHLREGGVQYTKAPSWEKGNAGVAPITSGGSTKAWKWTWRETPPPCTIADMAEALTTGASWGCTEKERFLCFFGSPTPTES